MGHQLVGIAGRAGICCATLTSGMRAEGRKNLGKRLQMVTRMVVTEELDSGPR
jgi:hypothetical protein